MDGANTEIREETVEDNMLTFGLLTPEIDSARSKIQHGKYKVQTIVFGSYWLNQERNVLWFGHFKTNSQSKLNQSA